MPKRIYNGSHLEVDVPLPDGKTLRAVRGEELEVPADIVGSLDEQGTWKKPSPTTAEKE